MTTMQELEGLVSKVHVVKDDTATPARREFRHAISKTFLAGTPELVVGRSQARRRVTIAVVASQAQQSVTPAVNQITLGATGVAAYNNNSVGVNQTITGGTVTAIAINGTTTGLTSGTFFVPAGGTVTVTYSVAPTVFSTAGIPVTSTVTTAPVILADNEADALNIQRWTQNGTVPGAVIGPGMAVHLDHNDEIWLAVVGSNTPPLVAVVAEFCQ